MANKQIHDYGAANTIDATADYFLVDPSSSGNYKKINRNTMLGITSAPLGLTDIQSPQNKTFDNTNTLTIKDGKFTLQNSSSVTKQAIFSLASVTAGQTRTITIPDSDLTLVGTSVSQTLTNKTIVGGNNTISGITESMLSTSDITTLNVSTSKHGFVPKAPNDTTKFLRGDGSWAAPATPSGQVVLLKANSGSDSTAGATSVDTYALSGLTAKDTLLVYYTLRVETADTAACSIYSNTDSAIIAKINANTTITFGNTIMGQAIIRQDPEVNTVYTALTSDSQFSSTGYNGTFPTSNMAGGTGSHTIWTGSWTIALRHGGVSAGGTLYWSWSLYKIAGQ